MSVLTFDRSAVSKTGKSNCPSLNIRCTKASGKESRLYEALTGNKNYQPCSQQEAFDRARMLDYMAHHPDYLSRENQTAHFSASIWTVNKARTKTLMVYHNIYDSWSWIGGHADGIEDLRAVALRELQEETGVRHAVLVRPDIFSLKS